MSISKYPDTKRRQDGEEQKSSAKSGNEIDEEDDDSQDSDEDGNELISLHPKQFSHFQYFKHSCNKQKGMH